MPSLKMLQSAVGFERRSWGSQWGGYVLLCILIAAAALFNAILGFPGEGPPQSLPLLDRPAGGLDDEDAEFLIYGEGGEEQSMPMNAPPAEQGWEESPPVADCSTQQQARWVERWEASHEAGPKCQPADAPTKKQFQLKIETINASCWAAARRRIQQAPPDLHAICVQEVRLSAAQQAEASRWLAGIGWGSVWAPAVRGAGGGWSAGVAVLGRSVLGIAELTSRSVRVDSRLVAAQLSLPEGKEIMIASAYLLDSEGIGEINTNIFEEIGKLAAEARQAQLELVIGGDWNNEPDAVARVVADADLHVRHGDLVLGSCVQSGCMPRTYDYFVTTAAADAMTEVVEVQLDACFYPHRPVRWVGKPGGLQLEAPQVQKPPAMGTQRLIGPLPRPPSYVRAHRMMQKAVATARWSTSANAIRRAQAGAYHEWAIVAEREVAAAVGAHLPRWGRRGATPRVKTMPLVPAPSKARTRQAATAAAVQWAERASISLSEMLVGEADAQSIRRAAGAWALVDHAEVREAAADLACEIHHQTTTTTTTGGGNQVVELVEMDAGAAENRDVLLVARALRQFAGWAREVANSPLEDARCRQQLCKEWQEGLAAQVLSGGSRRVRAARDADWTKWAKGAVQSGARAGHRWTQSPMAWVPTTTTRPDGTRTASGLDVANHYGQHFGRLWAATTTRPAQQPPPPMQRSALPRITAQQLRTLSRGWSAITAVGADGFAMCHYQHICDEGLEVLSGMFEAFELSTIFPPQWNMLGMPLLPKPAGGHRTIGIFPSGFRLWAKCRRSYCDEWERHHTRAFWGAGAGKRPLDPVWRWAVRAEAQRRPDIHTVAALVDVTAFYESIDHETLRTEAAATGFPSVLLEAALASYGIARLVRYGPFVADPRYATRGVVAGCSLATTFVKVYLLRRLDDLVLSFPRVHWNVFIDDVGVEQTGGRVAAAHNVAEAVDALKNRLAEVGCNLAPTKTQVVSSSRWAAGRVASLLELAPEQVAHKEAAKFLGADFAPAIPRRKWIGKSTRRGREQKVKKRLVRMRRLRRAAGPRARLVAAAGLVPQQEYGAEVTGLSDAELRSLRRTAAAGMGPRAGGRSLTATLLIENDPTRRAAVAVAVRWAEEVWAAANGCADAVPLPELIHAWEAVAARRWPRRWGQVCGPLGAAYLSLLRVGWSWPAPLTFADRSGREYLLTKVAPSMLQKHLMDAIRQCQESSLARGLARDDEVGRVSMAAVRRVLGAEIFPSPSDARGAATLRAVAASAVWTNCRLAEAGYDVDVRCALCGQAPDTLHHRWWECTASQQEREEIATPQTRQRARVAGPGALLFERAVLPHPSETWRGPSETPQAALQSKAPDGQWIDIATDAGEAMGCYAAMQGPGELFVDGSCTTHPVPECCRAAWAVVRVLPDGKPAAQLSGVVPAGWPQTAQAAEYFAASVAGQVAASHDVIRSDCLNVVHHFQADHAAQLSRRRRYAGVVRSARPFAGFQALRKIRKVPAHVKIEDCKTLFDTYCARGNDAADRAAKRALASHPCQSSVVLQQWAQDWEDAIATARLIIAVGPKWPAARAPDGGRLACPRRRTHLADAKASRAAAAQEAKARQRVAISSHNFQMCRGVLRCTNCSAHFSKGGAAVRLCPGQRAWLNALAENPRGHRLLAGKVLRPGEEPSRLVMCMRCGAWAETGTSLALKRGCPEQPSRAALEAIRRVREGLHPKCGKSARGGTVSSLRPFAAKFFPT